MSQTQGQLLHKAAINTTLLGSGGILSTQQADAFIDLTVDQSTLLKLIRIEKVNFPVGEIDKLNLGTPVSEKATEYTDSGNLTTATFSKVTYTTVKIRTAFDLTVEAEEDSIEGSNIRNTVLKAYANQMATDDEQLVIEGDSSLSGTDAESRLLKCYDGLNVLSASCPNYADGNGLGVSLKFFKYMLKKLPSKYKRIKSQLKWMVASAVYEDMQSIYGARSTSGGDTVYNQNVKINPFGIEMLEIPMIPTDLTIGTSGANGTFIILTAPKNLIYFVQRDMKIHFWFNARKDATEVTIYRRNTFNIENIDLMVKGRSISTAEGVSAYGA